jgi:imidazolonepropionase
MLPAVSGENWTRRIFYNYVPFLCRNKVYYGMSSALIYNVRQLVNTREESHVLRGGALGSLPCIDNAWIHIEGDRIAGYGPMSALPASLARLIGEGRDRTVDATGRLVLPAWCDSHTHLVYAGSREAEFVDKIRGLSYSEIAAKGGGILHSARQLAAASEDSLFNEAWQRLQELAKLGTGAIEIKSGYGLTVEGELKMLRVIKRLKEKSSLSIKASFLGAHTYPAEYRDNHAGYIDLIIGQMLPVIAHEGLADYIDVFCEDGFFSVAETEQIVTAGLRFGLRPKIHANQLHLSGGVQAGVRLGAISVDHLETMDSAAIGALAGSDTIGTLLPTAAFFLRMPFQPARELLDAGCAIALASDSNPGSSPSGNMNLVVSMSCIGMRMLPEEAINAATLNGAYAMSLGDLLGSITIGKRANLILTRPVPSLAYLPYAFGSNLIGQVMIGGEFVSDRP